MNRKTNIIVSITGIVIIILALLGLTYGYYMSKITGNETAKSVEVITGDSSVRFTDLSEDNINEIIEPGYTTTKTFTVENIGNISATYSIYFVDVYNDFVRAEDIVYTLYRIDNNSTFPTNYEGCIENPTNEKSCKIVVNSAEFPTSVALIKANETITTPGDIFKYDLVITYINQPTINQNVDQGHTFKGSVNLRASMDDFDNPFGEGTLAYTILKNSMNKLNGTEYIEPTLQDGTNYSKPAEQINYADEKILTYTTDDYGTSYYYRGNVTDNYVNFAEMCWRIVRIEGDGSVKLILEDAYAECNDNETEITTAVYTGNWSDGNTYAFGYDDSYKLNFLNYSGGLADSFKTFQTTKLSSTDLDKLKIGEWCYDNTVTNTDSDGNVYYSAYTRMYINKKPSLICTGTKLTKFKDNANMYVGTLTADEMSFAGAYTSTNTNYYLMNTYSNNNNNLFWYSLTPLMYWVEYNTDYVFDLYEQGSLANYSVSTPISSRPAVVLKSRSVIIRGEGTLEKPYIIG